jgi:hypothetical protein
VRPRLDDAVNGAGPVRAAPAIVVCGAFLAAAFVLDWLAPLAGQLAAGVLTWAVALVFIARADAVQRPMLFWCMAWATAGELFASLVWGLYTYRVGNIPHFVPPGHVLLFLLGWYLAPRLSLAAAHALTAAYAVLTLAALILWQDEFSVLLFAVYAALYWRAPGLRKLLATMFGLTLGIELFGTSLGVWGWAERTPWLDLTTVNPPVAVGAFYCTLDALTVWSARVGAGDWTLVSRSGRTRAA